VEDVVQLKQVAEGWYIEYKSMQVPTKNIAKSLAAFANHYGGWIFYGVEGERDGINLPDAFPGLTHAETADLIENLRNASKDLLNPSPYYEYKILHGPCESIGLSRDRNIVVVAVPSGINTPYVHGDGKIYRRVADASDPRAESDRFVLDQLWDRRKKAEEALAVFLQARPTVSRREVDMPFMHIFLLQDPLDHAHRMTRISFDEFVDMMSQMDFSGEGYIITFDNFYTMSNGFVARQVSNHDPYNLILTWQHFDDGSSLISVPLRQKFTDGSMILEEQYEYADCFMKQLQEKRHKNARIIDFHSIFLTIASCVSKQRILTEKGNVFGPAYIKIAFENIWRTLPFFDTDSYVQFIGKHGIPLIQYNNCYSPPGTTFDSFIKIDYENNKVPNELPVVMQLTQVASIVSEAGNAFGVPSHVLFDTKGEWLHAINRSIDIIRR
jgi:hypothetical protein